MNAVSSSTVALHLITCAKQAGIALSPMKLLKLVYLCQGYHLAFRDGKSLIREEVQAWQYGPVIPELYHAIKDYRAAPVTNIAFAPKEELTASQAEVVDAVFDAYQDYSAVQLSDITHRPGTPWSITWEKNKGRKNSVIPTSLIQEHYKELTS